MVIRLPDQPLLHPQPLWRLCWKCAHPLRNDPRQDWKTCPRRILWYVVEWQGTSSCHLCPQRGLQIFLGHAWQSWQFAGSSLVQSIPECRVLTSGAFSSLSEEPADVIDVTFDKSDKVVLAEETGKFCNNELVHCVFLDHFADHGLFQDLWHGED